jgi:hypothetical protein
MQLPKKRPVRTLDGLSSSVDKFVKKKTLSKCILYAADQSIIMNYFGFIEDKKKKFLIFEKSAKNVDWAVRNTPRFKEFVNFKKICLINETLDLNKDYDVKDLDRQKIKIDKMMDEFEKWILEPQVEVVENQDKSWKDHFVSLINLISQAEMKKKEELVSKYRVLLSSQVTKTA